MIFLKEKAIQQSSFLFLSQLFVLFVGVLTAPLLARGLGAENYGIFSFVSAAILFLAIFFEFGFFAAGARLIALTQDEKEERELIGALLMIGILIGISFFFVVAGSSLFIDKIFRTDVAGILRSIAIFAFVIPFQFMVQQICQGANRIHALALTNIIPRLYFLGGIIVVLNFFNLTILNALALNFIGVAIGIVFVIWRLKPLFSGTGKTVRVILEETKKYGIHMYIGRVIAVSAYNSDRLFISYFAGPLFVGFFSLAAIIVCPMAAFSQALVTSLFRDFSKEKLIPSKVIFWNGAWLAFAFLVLVFSAKFLVQFLFSNEYASVTLLILPLAVAGFFQGMSQPYNMFLSAHGEGRWLRNVSILFAVVSIVGNIIFISRWGALGAAYSALLIMAVSFFAYAYLYRKLIKREHMNKDIQGIRREKVDYFRRIWDESAKRKNPTEAVRFSENNKPLPVENYDRIAEGVKGLLRLSSQDDLLDVGCGNGLLLERLKPLVHSVTGTDLSQELLNWIKDPDIRTKCAQANALPFQDAVFHKIICAGVFQFFPDLEYAKESLNEFLRVLKPGGCILITDIFNVRLKDEYARTSNANRNLAKHLFMKLFHVIHPPVLDNSYPLFFDPQFFIDFFKDTSHTIFILVPTIEGKPKLFLKYRYEVLILKNAKGF